MIRTREDLAWAGGLFEGEGCITRNRAQPRMSVQMTDEDTVRRFAAIIGLGRVGGPYLPPSRAQDGKHKATFNWAIHGFEQCQAVVAMLWPWLGSRRRSRAEEVLVGYRQHGRIGRDANFAHRRTRADSKCS